MTEYSSNSFFQKNAGINLAPSQINSGGGLGSLSVTGINATTKTEILNLSGRFAVSNIHVRQSSGFANSGGELEVILDGRVLFDGTINVSGSSTAIFGTSTEDLAAMILVHSSLVVKFKRDGATNMILNATIFALE